MHWPIFEPTPFGFTTAMTLASSLEQDYKEFIELLNAHNVRYMVVGGYAVAYHGHVRTTGDIDIWVEISPDNAARLLQVMQAFGFGSLYQEADFLTPGAIIQLGVTPIRIDILTEVDGVLFADCFAVCEPTMWDGVNINFMSLVDLKKNKASTGRLKDAADLRSLNKVKRR